MIAQIPSSFQVKMRKLHKQRGEKNFNPKNALVSSTRISDLKSKKNYNYLGIREIIWVAKKGEDSQVQIIQTNILLS